MISAGSLCCCETEALLLRCCFVVVSPNNRWSPDNQENIGSYVYVFFCVSTYVCTTRRFEYRLRTAAEGNANGLRGGVFSVEGGGVCSNGGRWL